MWKSLGVYGAREQATGIYSNQKCSETIGSDCTVYPLQGILSWRHQTVEDIDGSKWLFQIDSRLFHVFVNSNSPIQHKVNRA